MESKSKNKPHAIVIPLPYQGIINPFINLALKLASKGFRVTFVHFHFIHHKLSKAHHAPTKDDDVDFFSAARESGLDIQCSTISDGLPLEFDRDLNFPEYWNLLYRDLPARVDEFVGKTIKEDGPAHVLVAEPLCAWPAFVADKYKLVNVAFSTQAAFAFCLAYHWDLLKEKGYHPCKAGEVAVEIDNIPGIESISTKDLMYYLDPEGPNAESLIAAYTNAKKADFILHNTVEELETYTLSDLNNHQPNYAIGPVNFFKNLPTNAVTKSFWAESDCSSWLGSRPDGSVLFVSFGSLAKATKQFVEEIAYGLLLSGVDFIWVVREGIVVSSDEDSSSSVLPVGFKDEIGDKGLIVSWCDQIAVLSEPAVGGFVTHCGWNSTLESMWCGVPMLCYPLLFDQPTNRKYVVEDWKIGIDLCDRGVSIDRTKVAEKIKSCMNGSSGKSLRQAAENVKMKLRNALENDGSSEKNFDRFIDDLNEKIGKFT